MRLPATDTSILGKPSAALVVLWSQLCVSPEIMAIYATSITSAGGLLAADLGSDGVARSLSVTVHGSDGVA